MLKAPQILVRTLVLGAGVAALAGCGQKGPLFLPTDPAAAGRATLPQTLRPKALGGSSTPPAAAPAGPRPTGPQPPPDYVPGTPPDADSLSLPSTP